MFSHSPARSLITTCLVTYLVLCALTLGGCAAGGWTQSAFTRAVNNAGSEFAAAAVTLQDAHTGRLTAAYVRASFVNYKTQLSGLDQSLPSQANSSERKMVQHLLALYHAAWPAVASPCLATACDWQRQLHELQAASAAFLQAGST